MKKLLENIFLNSRVIAKDIEFGYEIIHEDYKVDVESELENVQDTLLVVIRDCKIDVNKLVNDFYNQAKKQTDLNTLLEIYDSEIRETNLILCKAIGEKRRKNVRSYIDALNKEIESKEEAKKVFESWL